jgi:hypothetical protein
MIKKIIKENEEEISPLRFHLANIDDIVGFIDDIANGTSLIELSEKIAGQHLTVTIKNNYVYVQTKDAILSGADVRNASEVRFGSNLTRAIIEVTKRTRLPDQVWRFEMIHPAFNHDYVKYRNKEIIFAEYTGRLNTETANLIRSKMRDSKLLTKKDLVPKIIDNPLLLKFKDYWKRVLRSKIVSLRSAPEWVKHRELNRLKREVGKVIEKAFLSVVDEASPIEGLVVKGKSAPFKVSSTSFREIQLAQLPVYSFFKLKKEEIDYVLEDPEKTINDLRLETGLEFSSVYDFNSNVGLFQTLKNYFKKASKLTEIDKENFDLWISPEQANDFYNTLTKENSVEIYFKLWNIVKGKSKP